MRRKEFSLSDENTAPTRLLWGGPQHHSTDILPDMENRGSEATHLSISPGGSCFFGPPTRSLHRQHRTVRPAENVNRRIPIRVSCTAADSADKPRLADTAFCINHAAIGAGLACVCGFNFN